MGWVGQAGSIGLAILEPLADLIALVIQLDLGMFGRVALEDLESWMAQAGLVDPVLLVGLLS